MSFLDMPCCFNPCSRRVDGLERNTNSQVCVPHQARGRIEATQLAVMREVGIQALAGLRKE